MIGSAYDLVPAVQMKQFLLTKPRAPAQDGRVTIRRRWGVSGVVARYTVLLALLFSLPLVTFVFVNGFFVARMVEENVVDSYARQLDRITSHLDQEVGRLRPIAQAMVHDARLRGFWHDRERYDSGSGFRALRDFSTVNGFFDHIVLYSYNRPYLLTSQGSYRSGYFYTDVYSHSGWNEENLSFLLASIHEEKTLVLSNPGGARSSIGIFVPVPMSGTPVRGHISFVFGYSRIDELLQARGDAGMSVYLFDEDGALLYTNHDGTGPGIGALSDQLETAEASSWTATVELGGESYLLATDATRRFDWRIIAVSPTSVATSHVVWLRNLLLAVVLGLVALGVPLIFAIMRHLHRPLEHLAESLGSADLYQSHGDEWQTIEAFVHDLRTENVQLRTISSFSQTSALSRLFLRLLRGQFESFEDFHRLAAYTGRDNIGEGCFVALIGVGAVTQHEPARKQDMVATLNEATTTEVSFVAVDALQRTVIPIIVQGAPDHAERTAGDRGTLEYLQGVIHNRLDGGFPIGVGRGCEKPCEVPTSLNEARQALQYGFLLPTGSVVRYAEVESRELSRLPPPRKLLDGFRDSLRTLDTKEIEQALSELIREISNQEYSIRVVRFVLFEVMGCLWEQVVSANVARDREQAYFAPLRSMEHAETIEQFRKQALELVDGVIDEARYDEPHLRSQKLVHDVTHYLDTAYTDMGLTLAGVADRFGVTPSNLSHHFKSKVGKTVMAYLDDVRMSHAKRLLLKSDVPLSDIVGEVGYFDVSNFIKKFKRCTGKTPGRYRKNGAGGRMSGPVRQN